MFPRKKFSGGAPRQIRGHLRAVWTFNVESAKSRFLIVSERFAVDDCATVFAANKTAMARLLFNGNEVARPNALSLVL
jgi:hypothetical protein